MTQNIKAELIFRNYKLVSGKIEEQKVEKIENLENYREEFVFMSPIGEFFQVITELVFEKETVMLLDECSREEITLFIYKYRTISYNRINL